MIVLPYELVQGAHRVDSVFSAYVLLRNPDNSDEIVWAPVFFVYFLYFVV